MIRISLLALTLILTTHATFSQDCSTLIATASITSDYNGQLVSCTGASNAMISVSASGGTGPYVYTFENMPANTSGFTTGVFTGISAGGPYVFRVLDNNNCFITTSPLLVVEPTLLVAAATVTSDYNGYAVSCFGNSNGAVTAAASGGTGSYTYQLIEQNQNTSGFSTGVFTGLSANMYTVRVLDINNCQSVSNAVVINQPAFLTANATITSSHGNNGSVELTVQGGTNPYTFSWSDESTEQNLVNVGNGEYTVEIKDKNNCLFTDDFTVPLVVGLPEDQQKYIRVLYDHATAMHYLTCSTITSGKISIRLYDLKGATKYSLDTRQEAGVNTYNLTPQLAPGLYIARVHINQTIYSLKFIVF